MRALLLPFRWVYRGLVWVANSPRTLILSYLVMIVISGVIYSIVEHRGAGDSVWWAVVTASTVGYGDISPSTPLGRFLAALLISTMVLLVIPLITAHFASKLIVDADAFRHEEQEELKTNLRVTRALLEELAVRHGINLADLTLPGGSSSLPSGSSAGPGGRRTSPGGRISAPGSEGPSGASSGRSDSR